MEVGEEVCGTKEIKEGKRRRGSEEIRRVFGRKKECYLIGRRTRSEEDLDEYRRMKRMVREAKKRVNEEGTLSMVQNFKENRKTFWKGVRKRESLRPLSMRNSMERS